MKRHPALEPFSRDHNDGLILARHLIENRPRAAEEFLRAWVEELQDHFLEEERLLSALAGDLADRLREEHAEIESLSRDLPESSERLGLSLEAHIRWEERVLFPAIEQQLDETRANELAKETLMVEQKRWPSNPLRERLVRRRLERIENLEPTEPIPIQAEST